MSIAPDPDESTLAVTDLECLECGVIYEDEHDACPYDAEHPTTLLHITKTPLGYEDDQDWWHPRLLAYAYNAADPR